MSMPASIGRYAITGTLGEGGMGVVYAAMDERLGRPVAIKMIKTAVAGPVARERLVREARTAASISHPAICQLYEIGEEAGELFLAMELLQGESLAARIARGAVPAAEAGGIALGILSGVEVLHKQGLVHRDLKPSNVFLTSYGVKLLDFGLTCSTGIFQGETNLRMTATGTVVGTPQYAAPEQLRNEPLDSRTDLFAAGVVLFEMLAGRPPFTGHSTVEVFHAVMYEQPPVLSGSPAVSALDRIVHRSLAKRPADRYDTADLMAQDVRAALALGDSGSISAVRAVTRLIVLPFRVLRPDAETDFLSYSLADAVTSGLTGLASLVVRSSLVASRFASDAPDLKALASGVEVDAALVGTLLRAGDQLRVSSQLVEVPSGTVVWSHTAQVPVGDLFGLQDELTRKIVDSLSLPLTAREHRILKQDVPASPQVYETYLRANEMARKTPQWRAALDLYQRCIDDDPRYAPAWAGLGRMRRILAKYVEGETESLLREAEAALKRALELNPDLSVAENEYAHLEIDLGRAENAMVRLIRRARERSADPQLYAGLVHACRYCGLMQASIAAAEHARRLDPKIATSIAHTFFMRGDYVRVLDYPAESIPYLRNLAMVMLQRGSEALESLVALEPTLPQRLTMLVTALRHLVQDEREQSLEWIRQVRDWRDPEARFYAARQMAYLGDTDGALRLLELIVQDGFFCLPTMTRDPWLDPLRGTAEFSAVLRTAEGRHRQAVISFIAAEGDRVLGVAQPV